MTTPYKFVKWNINPLESLKGDNIFILHEKRHALTQQEKNNVFTELQNNIYSKHGIPREGWMFPFNDIINPYLVKLKYHGWQEVFAPNKTSIRAYFHSRCLEIVTIKIVTI